MESLISNAAEKEATKAKLIEFMEQNNITARELSLSLGYNEGYISRILKGKIDPSFKSMMDTMLYFDIRPAEFFTFDLISHTES